MRFNDKTVLITGSSRNTGYGMARAFLREGATVFVNGASVESTDRAVAELREEGFDRMIELPGSIADVKAVETMFQILRQKVERLDILVNNACQQGIGNSFEAVSFEAFEEVVKTNLLGTFYVSRLAAELMLQQSGGPGVIVNIGSNVSTRAIHKRAAYCASKGGVDGLTRAMAIDLGPLGIRVNSVAPGYIFTERWETLSETHKVRRRLNAPLGKEASYDDIAEAVMFLASDAAKNICGARLVVDGGCTAQHMPIDVDL